MLIPLPTKATDAHIQSFIISPGSLRNALDTFATQSDVQLIYLPELARGKTTHGVSGRFTSIQALQQLLRGTDLSLKALNDATFVLEASHPIAVSSPTAVVPTTQMLSTVDVSGSLIGNTAIQTATPTYTITAVDMKARSFNTIAEVLHSSVFSTGSVQGPQTAGSFTQGAQPISLFGLGPQFTLILIDGKPIASFGRLYNGSINFTSVANLPLTWVDHIDVMPGGASPIYGSQAIGGVINIVTKSHMDGGQVSVRTGKYSDGGGASQQISFIYGHDWHKFNLFVAGEFDNTLPIWGYQRSLTRSSSSGPMGNVLPTAVQAGIIDNGPYRLYSRYALNYLTPPSGCANNLFAGSTTFTTSKYRALPGYYCGSDRLPSIRTYSNQVRSYAGTLKLSYQANDYVRLYANFMLSWQQQRWYSGVPNWLSTDFDIEDATTTHLLFFEKNFAPEEMPNGVNGQMYSQNDLLYQSVIGINGQWSDSSWRWDLYYLRTGDRTKVTEPLLVKTNVDNFFAQIFGPVIGIDPITGLNMYKPNYHAFFQAITPMQYSSFTQRVSELSNTWINSTRATLSNPSLFTLPDGDVGFAALLESGNEAWYEPADPFFTQDRTFEHATTSGGGQRSHFATAFELNSPITKALTLDISGRYDHYALRAGSNNHKFTYKTGFEFRPTDSWLFRGNYTTSFKAPTLASIFLGPTDYYTDITDYYRCAQIKIQNCGNSYHYSVKGTAVANPELQPTTAQSLDVGTVWAPTNNLMISIDYLRIAIKNEIVTESTDRLMRIDAQCLLGSLDPLSKACQAITNPIDGQVRRINKYGYVTAITTRYENLAEEATKSIIGSVRYRFFSTKIGTFWTQLDYNNMLQHDYRITPDRQVVNRLAYPQSSSEFRTIMSGSVTWKSLNQHWSSTVYAHRYGSSPNYAATNAANNPHSGRLSPWVTFNASLSYRPKRQVEISVLINNIANQMPPKDPTYAIYPYFNVENYNIYGREIMLQLDLKFDKSKAL